MMKRLLSLLLVAALLLTAVPALADWTCACGTSNDAKFCTECGSAKPADDTWTCGCGKQNSSKFCSSCGRAKDAANSCAACGYKPADGGAFKFCPSCGTAFGASGGSGGSGGTVAGEPLKITSATNNRDGTVTIRWKGGSAPYTVYCTSYSGSRPQVVVADTWDTSITTRVMEPFFGYKVWVTGGGESEKHVYSAGDSFTSFHDLHGEYIFGGPVQLKINHGGSAQKVDSYSAWEIENTKASGSGWTYDYCADAKFTSNCSVDRTIRLQVYVTTPGGSIIHCGVVDDVFVPAGEECVVHNAVQLYACFVGEQVETGSYSVSYYDGYTHSYITSASFLVND